MSAKIDLAEAPLEALTGEEAAREWRRALLAEICRLRTNPLRHPIIPEQAHFPREARQFVFRRPGAPGSSFAYRILFTVEDAAAPGAAESLDGPMVKVFHVRHATARPIGRQEAGELKQAR